MDLSSKEESSRENIEITHIRSLSEKTVIQGLGASHRAWLRGWGHCVSRHSRQHCLGNCSKELIQTENLHMEFNELKTAEGCCKTARPLSRHAPSVAPLLPSLIKGQCLRWAHSPKRKQGSRCRPELAVGLCPGCGRGEGEQEARVLEEGQLPPESRRLRSHAHREL